MTSVLPVRWACPASEEERREAFQELVAWFRAVELDMLTAEQETGRTASTAAPQAHS